MTHTEDKCGATLHSFLKRICLYFHQNTCVHILSEFLEPFQDPSVTWQKSVISNPTFIEMWTLPMTTLFPSSSFCSLAPGFPVHLIAELFCQTPSLWT